MKLAGSEETTGVREKVIAEMRRLRKGVGLNDAKFRSSSHLREVLARSFEQHHQRPAFETDLYRFFVHRVGAFEYGLHGEAMKNALGLGLPRVTMRLEDRRNDFGQRHGGRHADTVENWENRAFDEFVARLLRDAD